MRLGFAGIGLMGLPMSQRLLAANYDLTVWNRDSKKAEVLLSNGAKLVSTAADLATASDVIFLCLFDAKAVESVVFGAQGIIHTSCSKAKIIVDHSSISPQQTKDFAARLPKGWHWLDAPVSGGTGGAEQGTLAVMVGGDQQALHQVEPIMQAYAARITHMGAVGAGQVTKLCNQTIVTATIAAIAEAICLAQDAQVSSEQLATALSGGWADSILLQIFVERMHDLPSTPTASVATMLKDLNAIAAQAQGQGTAMPVSHAVQQLCQLASRQGLGDNDISYLIQTLKA